MSIIADGIKFSETMREWLGDGAQPDPRAQDRGDVCSGRITGRPCEFNWRGGWLMRKEVADTVRRWLEAKQNLKLQVEGEDQLGTCEVCRCTLSLKIHIPLKTILAHSPKGELEKLPPHCWVLTESKP